MFLFVAVQNMFKKRYIFLTSGTLLELKAGQRWTFAPRKFSDLRPHSPRHLKSKHKGLVISSWRNPGKNHLLATTVGRISIHKTVFNLLAQASNSIGKALWSSSYLYNINNNFKNQQWLLNSCSFSFFWIPVRCLICNSGIFKFLNFHCLSICSLNNTKSLYVITCFA